MSNFIRIPLKDLQAVYNRNPTTPLYGQRPAGVNYTVGRRLDCFSFMCSSTHEARPRIITTVGEKFVVSDLTLGEHAQLSGDWPSATVALTPFQYTEYQRRR